MGSEGGARCVPYWTVLCAKSSLGDCPGKEYITVRNSYIPLENLEKIIFYYEIKSLVQDLL